MTRRAAEATGRSSSVAPGMALVFALFWLALFLLVLLWLPGSAFGQELDSTQVILADSTGLALPDSSGIVVGADMRFYDPLPGARLSPFSGRTVKRDNEGFLALATTTPGEAFALEPGIDLLEYGSAGLPQALRVRASRPRDVLYLMDGIPVSDDRLEIFDQNWLPLSGMERAEVALNGQSGLFGSGATAGVMNLESMSAMPQVPTSEVVAWWGSFDSRAVHFRFNRRITSRFGILLSFENLHSGGWTESSEANSNKFFGKLTGFLGRGLTCDIVGYRYDGAIELPDSCPEVAATDPASRDDKRDFIRVSVAGGTDTSVRLDYFYLGTERDFSSGDVNEDGEGSLNGFAVTTTRVTADSSLGTFGAGLKRYKLRYDLRSSYLKEASTNDIYGYIAGEKRLNAWRLRGSFRVDVNSRSGTELAGDLGASFKATPWCLLFGRIDRSFTNPTLRDATPAVEFGAGGGDAVHWNGLELGADLGGDPARLSAALFWRQVDNSTMLVRNEACEVASVGDKEVSYLGAEAILHFTYPSWFKGSLGYSAERARDGAGDKVNYVPSGTFTWDLRASGKFSSHISAGLTFAGRWVSPVWVGNQPIPCSEGGCVHDAELDSYVSGLLYGYIDIDSGRIYARIRNLFKQRMTQLWGYPELPPRTFELGVNMRLRD